MHPLHHFAHGHSGYVGYALAAYPYVLRLFPEAQTAAVRADGFSLEARQHDTVLDLGVLVFLQHAEEVVQSAEILVTCPDQLFLFGCECVERRVNREVELSSVIDQFVAPFAHFLSAPAGYSVFVDTLGFVGHYQIHVNAYYIAESVACRAGAQRVIEVEQVLCRFNELYTVCLKPLGEMYHLYSAFVIRLSAIDYRLLTIDFRL